MYKAITLYQTADGVTHSTPKQAHDHAENQLGQALENFLSFAYGENNLHKPSAYKAISVWLENPADTKRHLKLLLEIIEHGE